MKYRLLNIIVVYNEYIYSSKIYLKLLKLNQEICVFDNSTNKKYIDQNKKMISGDKYISNNENLGLSKAYNIVINKFNNYDYYCTWDSDSEFDDNYFLKFNEAIDNDIKVYIPDIVGLKTSTKKFPKNYKIYPFIFFNTHITKDEIGYFMSINSGNIYSKDVFKQIKFNEELFLEHIDADIFVQMKKQKIMQKRICSVIYQDFSIDVASDVISQRDLNRKKDAYKFYGKSWFIFVFIMYLKKAIIFKDKRFITNFFDIYMKREK